MAVARRRSSGPGPAAAVLIVATRQQSRWPLQLGRADARLPSRPVPAFLRVALAALGLAVALFLTPLAGDWLVQTPLGLLYAAVACAAALGGMGLGIVTMLAAVALAELFLYEPHLTIPLTAEVLVRDGLFVAVSLSLTLLVDRLQRARGRADLREQESRRLTDELRERAAELELQISEAEVLTDELARVNRQLEAQTTAATRAAARAERLHQFTALLLDQTGEAAVARTIVEEGRRALEADAAVLGRASGSGVVEVLTSAGDVRTLFGDPADFCQPDSPVHDAVRRSEAGWIDDGAALVRDYPRLAGLGEAGHRAWCALPLLVEQRHVGCLALGFDRTVKFSAEERSFMLLLAQQCGQALDRARSYDHQRRARVRAEFAERRLAFLADASERLASSLDLLHSLANLAEYAVPEFADWCLIHLASERSAPVVVAAAHSDPERLERWRELEQRYPPSPEADHGIGRVLRTGERYHGAATDQVLRAVARDEDHLRMLRQLGLSELLAVPVSANGRTSGVITFALSDASRTFDDADITLADELGRRAGQAVQNARLYQAAQHASEAKSSFLAIISHELRTPLNAIIGYSDLLLMGVPNEIPQKALHQVERIRVSARALLHLVEEVLSFSRIEAGKEEIRISPVDLKALLGDCLALVEPMALHKELEVRVAMPDEPVKIVSDERKIRQIVTNLLSNAVKFTEQGMVSVKLRRRGDEVHILVADTGIGISREHLERIFDPFWQVEPATTRRFGGTGLGLGVARKLARLLDGRLDVRSVEGKGSTFVLALPLHVHHMSRTTR